MKIYLVNLRRPSWHPNISQIEFSPFFFISFPVFHSSFTQTNSSPFFTPLSLILHLRNFLVNGYDSDLLSFFFVLECSFSHLKVTVFFFFSFFFIHNFVTHWLLKNWKTSDQSLINFSFFIQ